MIATIIRAAALSIVRTPASSMLMIAMVTTSATVRSVLLSPPSHKTKFRAEARLRGRAGVRCEGRVSICATVHRVPHSATPRFPQLF